MAYRIVAKSPKHLNDIIEDVMSWFETARDYRVEFDTESVKFADPVTKRVGFKDIDVLRVQDTMTGKKNRYQVYTYESSRRNENCNGRRK